MDTQGFADQSAVGNDDGLLLSSDDFEDRKGGGGGRSTSNNRGDSSGSGNSQSGGGTAIYRFGYTGPDKLVPDQRDVNSDTGLSFSTRYRTGAAATTIEAVNSTGTLIAVQDGGTHVSVYPVGTTMQGWHDAGANSIWTQTLVSIVSMT